MGNSTPSRILIIEDRTLISDLMSSSLEQTGDFQAVSVPTIAEALEMKADKQFDLVMLETSLAYPVQIGDVQDVVRKCHPAKVVLFDNAATHTFVQNCLDIGVSGLIPKQFSFESLILALKLIHRYSPCGVRLDVNIA